MLNPEISNRFEQKIVNKWLDETDKYKERIHAFFSDRSNYDASKGYDSSTDLHFSDNTSDYSNPYKIESFYNQDGELEKIKATYRKEKGGIAEAFIGGKALKDFLNLELESK